MCIEGGSLQKSLSFERTSPPRLSAFVSQMSFSSEHGYLGLPQMMLSYWRLPRLIQVASSHGSNRLRCGMTGGPGRDVLPQRVPCEVESIPPASDGKIPGQRTAFRRTSQKEDPKRPSTVLVNHGAGPNCAVIAETIFGRRGHRRRPTTQHC